MGCLQQPLNDSGGRCQETPSSLPDGDAVDREKKRTYVPLSTFASRFRDTTASREGIFFFFFSLRKTKIDEGSRAAYFFSSGPLTKPAHSSLHKEREREKLSFFAFLSRNQSVFILPSLSFFFFFFRRRADF